MRQIEVIKRIAIKYHCEKLTTNCSLIPSRNRSYLLVKFYVNAIEDLPVYVYHHSIVSQERAYSLIAKQLQGARDHNPSIVPGLQTRSGLS